MPDKQHPTPTIPSVDLNADLGEGFPWDEPLLDLVSSASISCGAHAGDPETIRRTLTMAHEKHVRVGAHPGFADREHFGRREHPVSMDATYRLVRRQLDDLIAISRPLDVPIRFLKPHGALYNQAQHTRKVAFGVAGAAGQRHLAIVGQPTSQVEAMAAHLGVRFISEGFVDRRYQPNGRLVPRDQPGAILSDPAEIADQVRSLVQRGIQTLCIHGDNPDCLTLAQFVREVLAHAGVAIRAFI